MTPMLTYPAWYSVEGRSVCPSSCCRRLSNIVGILCVLYEQRQRQREQWQRQRQSAGEGVGMLLLLLFWKMHTKKRMKMHIKIKINHNSTLPTVGTVCVRVCVWHIARQTSTSTSPYDEPIHCLKWSTMRIFLSLQMPLATTHVAGHKAANNSTHTHRHSLAYTQAHTRSHRCTLCNTFAACPSACGCLSVPSVRMFGALSQRRLSPSSPFVAYPNCAKRMLAM